MSEQKIGDYFSFHDKKTFALSIKPGWFLVIQIQDEKDGEPKGTYLIETWTNLPETAEPINVFEENFGGMGISIALAFSAATCALCPTESLKTYLRPNT